MTNDPREVQLALSLIAAAQQQLQAVQNSRVLTPDGRERLHMIVGRLEVEGDIIRGAVAGGVTVRHGEVGR